MFGIAHNTADLKVALEHIKQAFVMHMELHNQRLNMEDMKDRVSHGEKQIPKTPSCR